MINEIGEELEPNQLQPETVVVLRANHRPDVMITAWFLAMEDGYAMFHMGETKMTLVARVQNGKLFDDTNHQIHVYRWKGDI